MSKIDSILNYKEFNDISLTITGHDLLGNELFKPVVLYYKLGEHVHYTIPELKGYYLDEDRYVDFCITDDIVVDYIYKKAITPHIDILSTDNEVKYCGKLDIINASFDINGETYSTLFEGETIIYTLPDVDGYYRLIDSIELTLEPHIVIYDAYQKIESIGVKYVDEKGELLYIDHIDDIVESLVINKHYSYEVNVIDDFSDKYYYENIDNDTNIIEIPLDGKNVEYEVLLYRYRTVAIRVETIYGGEVESYEIKTIKDHVKIGDTIEYNYNSYMPTAYPVYMLDGSERKFVVGENLYNEDLAICLINTEIWYRYITYKIMYIDLYTNKSIYNDENDNPIPGETIDGLMQDRSYAYEVLEVENYVTHVGNIYLRSNKDTTIDIYFHPDTRHILE